MMTDVRLPLGKGGCDWEEMQGVAGNVLFPDAAMFP